MKTKKKTNKALLKKLRADILQSGAKIHSKIKTLFPSINPNDKHFNELQRIFTNVVFAVFELNHACVRLDAIITEKQNFKNKTKSSNARHPGTIQCHPRPPACRSKESETCPQ